MKCARPMLMILMLMLPLMMTNLQTEATGKQGYDHYLKIDRDLIRQIEGDKVGSVDAVVVAENGYLGSVESLVFSAGGIVRKSLSAINSLAVTLPREVINDIARSNDVKKIWADYQVTFDIGNSTSFMKQELLRSMAKDPAMNATKGLSEKLKLSLCTLLETGMQSVTLGSGAKLVEAAFSDISPQSYFTYQVGAEKMWAMGYTGTGTCVAILDNGATASHPMISSAIIGGHSEVPFEPEWDDYWALHGTLTSSMAVGRPYVLILPDSDNLATAFVSWFPNKVIPPGVYPWGEVPPEFVGIAFIGEAPEAMLWVEKITSFEGFGQVSWILAGMQHVLDMRLNSEVKVDVVSMSVGMPLPWRAINDGTDPWSLMVDTLVSNGITVVQASGNEGPGAFTISPSAVATKNIGVGGYVYARMLKMYLDFLGKYSHLAHMGDDDEMIWYFSSRGPTRDYRTGISVVAPCAFTMGAVGYSELTWCEGTSFAAPRVAGEALLLIQYYRDKTGNYPSPEKVRAAIVVGADYISGYERIDQGGGRWNPYKAAQVMLDHNVVGRATDILKSDEYHNQRVKGQTVFKTGVFETTVKSLGIEHFARFCFSLTDPDMYRVSITDIAETQSGMNTLYVYVFDPKGDRANIGLAFEEEGVVMQYGAAGYYGAMITYGMKGGLYKWNQRWAPNDPGIWEVVVENDYFSSEPVSFTIRIEKSEVSMSASAGKLCLKNQGVDMSLGQYEDSGYVFSSGLSAYEGYKRTISGSIRQGELFATTFTVEPYSVGLSVTLDWNDDYSTQFPADLDLYLIDPLGTMWFSYWPLYPGGIFGATANIPETDYFGDYSASSIVSGVWTLLVIGNKVTPASAQEGFAVEIECRVREATKTTLRYEVTETPYFEETIPETIVVVGESIYGTYDLPFEFPFCDGKSYKTLCVNTNGYITFDQGFEQAGELKSLFVSTPMIAVMAMPQRTVVYAVPHDQYVTLVWYGYPNAGNAPGGPSQRQDDGYVPIPCEYMVLARLYDNGDIVLSYAHWLTYEDSPNNPVAGVSKGDNLSYVMINPDNETAFQFKYSVSTYAREIWNYGVNSEPCIWEPEGDLLCSGYDSCAPYTLPFSFAFYGTSYDTVYVSSDGYVTFDECHVCTLPSDMRNLFNTKPTIAVMGRNMAMYHDFMEAQWHPKVFVTDHGDYVTIMWNGTPENYEQAIREHDLMLLRLYTNGDIVMSYNDWVGGLAGVSNGDGATNVKILPMDEMQFRFTYSGMVTEEKDVNYEVADEPYFFENVTALPLIFGELMPTTYTLPFDFPFYWETYQTVYLSTHGFLTFTEMPLVFEAEMYHMSLLTYPMIAATAQNLVTAAYVFEHDDYVDFMWYGRKTGYEAVLGVFPGMYPLRETGDTESPLGELFPAGPIAVARLYSDGRIAFSYMNWLGPEAVGPAVAGVSGGGYVNVTKIAPYQNPEPKAGLAFEFTAHIIPASVSFSDGQPWLPANSVVQVRYEETMPNRYIFAAKCDWLEKYTRDGNVWTGYEEFIYGCSIYENARTFY